MILKEQRKKVKEFSVRGKVHFNLNLHVNSAKKHLKKDDFKKDIQKSKTESKGMKIKVERFM